VQFEFDRLGRLGRQRVPYRAGFSLSEVVRLAEMKQRYNRGEYRSQEFERRLLFVRWLVQHDRLNEFLPATYETTDGTHP
jgi:hypothetical protein